MSSVAAQPEATLVAEVHGLSLAYRHGEDWLQVLEEVNFSIARGEALGLVGESGCGKSTVAYALLGYRAPNSKLLGGSVRILGEDVLAMDRAQLDQLRGRRVSFVPQNPTMALSPHMRVGRQIAETLTRHGQARSDEEAANRALELFRLVSLPQPEALVRRYPHQLSGGQQQRVCIAMALACDPDLVVLDEPTTGLDVTTQEQVVHLLRDLRAKLGMSMLYVTHDLGLLSEIADRVGVMYAGHMVEVAGTEELYRHPRHPYTRGLIASIPRIDRGEGGGARPLRGLLRREELPRGCPFFPRCDFAEPSCAETPQALSAVSESHRVACQRWSDIVAPSLASAESATTTEDQPIVAAPVLKLENVTLSYGRPSSFLDRVFSSAQEPVVHDVSFEIQDGECFALVGESGSGKSTIARAVSGLLDPLAGRILFEDRPVAGDVRARSRDDRRRIQFIFQNPDGSLNPRARVGAILARPLRVFFDLDRRAEREAVAGALDDVRLDAGYARRYPDQLSGGERQRVAIARALIADPDLLLCDEVLSALDVSVQANILELFKRLRRETRIAMLFISHDLAVVRSLADRVAVLFHGRLCEIGEVERLFSPPFHPYTYSLLMATPGTRRERAALAERDTAAPAAGAKGCVYAGRCAWQAGALCEQTPPPWREYAEGARIRCHLALDELAARADWLSAAPPPPIETGLSTSAGQDT